MTSSVRPDQRRVLVEGQEIAPGARAFDVLAHLHAHAHASAFAARWWTGEQARGAWPYARDVLDADPDDALALCHAGHCTACIGHQYEAGLAALKRAAILNPNSGTVAMLLGWVLIYLDQNDAAVEQLERAKRISPLHPHIAVMNSGIANAYTQKGELETALQFYEQARAEYPEFASNQIGLMALYRALGRTEDARAMAEWLRAKVPDTRISAFTGVMPQRNKTYILMVVDTMRDFGVPD